MNKSTATVRRLKKGAELAVAKEVHVPYYTSSFSNESKVKASNIVFSMIDNLQTIARKLYALLGVDPRDQVIFFQRGAEVIFTPTFSDGDAMVSFDPREVWRGAQTEFPFDQASFDALTNKKYVRVDSVFSNLFGVEDQTGAVDISVLALSDFFAQRFRLQQEVENPATLDRYYFGFVAKYSIASKEQFYSLVKGAVYGQEADEDFLADLTQKLKSEAQFVQWSPAYWQTFSAQLGYVTIHYRQPKPLNIDVRQLFDQLDINNMITLNHIAYVQKVEDSVYQVFKTRGGMLAEAMTDPQIQYDAKAVNLVIGSQFILQIRATGDLLIKRYIHAERSITQYEQLWQIVSPDKLLQSSEMNQVQAVLRAQGVSLDLHKIVPRIRYERMAVTFYQGSVSSAADSKSYAPTLSVLEEIGILRRDPSAEDRYALQRITEGEIQITFRKAHVKLTCQVSEVDDIFLKALLTFLRQMFDFGEKTRAAKGAKADASSTLISYDANLFRNIKEGLLYSRLCQKQKQPTVISKEEFEKRKKDKDQKRSVVRYRNFSTMQDAYYACNNSYNKYIYFLTGRHNDNYCLPCCKKIKPSESAKDIVDKCSETGQYEGKKKTKYGQYVIKSYRQLKPRRIAELPQNVAYILEDKCFILGVEQAIAGQQVGLFYSCVALTDRDPIQFIDESMRYYRSKKNIQSQQSRSFAKSITQFFAQMTEVTAYNSNVDVYQQDLVHIMPYVFAIDLIFIDVHATIKTLGLPLQRKGLVFESDVGTYPIIRTHPARYQEFNEIKNRTFETEHLRVDRLFYKKVNSFETIYRYAEQRGLLVMNFYANADDYLYGMLAYGPDDDRIVFLPFEVVPRKQIQKQMDEETIQLIVEGAFDPSKYNISNEEVQRFSNYLYDQGANPVQSLIIKGKQTVVAFTQMNLVVYCQPTPLAKLKVRFDARTRNVFLQHDIHEINDKLYKLRKQERETQTPILQINDPKIETSLKHGLLLQNFYKVLKLTAIASLKAKGFTPESFFDLDYAQTREIVANAVSLKQVAQYDVRRYNNVTNSCQTNPDQAYCQGSDVLTVDAAVAEKYIEIVAYEIHRAPVVCFENTQPGIIDLLDFDARKGQISYSEIKQNQP